MTINTIGIIGHGAFGTLVETLIRRFAPEIGVRIHSRREVPDGKRFFSLEDTCNTDALILAVPIASFEETLALVLPLTKKETVLIDIATVKTHTSELLRKLAGDRLFISSHPMFGPESYKKLGEHVNGLRIVLTDTTLPEDTIQPLLTFLEKVGFSVVRMSSEEHDQRLAQTLFLTHFVGQVVARAGFARTDIDSVSFGFLMEAVESVKNDTALFRDVFRFNPFCKDTLERFEKAETEVHGLLESR